MMRRLALGAALLLAFARGNVRAQETDNPHGNIKDACGTCHTPNSWTSIKVAEKYEHAPRSFPLDGAHARVSCSGCHKVLEFSKASTSCASCHQDVHKGELGVTCSNCHTTRSFVDRATMLRAHELTRFPLRGAHVGADCAACHTSAPAGRSQFVNTATQCSSCHITDYRNTTTPGHVAARISTDCASCHTVVNWLGAPFDHSKTAFALTGAHVAQTCNACHADKVFTGRSSACVSCHQRQYDATANPKHPAAGFSTTCLECHNTTSYRGATYDHSKTRFPLTGAHGAATCAACHGDQLYRGKSMACGSCHMDDFSATKQPPHAASGFPTTCETCHSNTTTWMGGTVAHSATRFPLTGAHLATTCADCHGDGVYRGKPTTCVSCHQTEFTQTTNPHHAPAGFATTCESCHTTSTFAGARFDHATTSFPLTGVHIAQTCLACHADRIYDGKPQTCVACHLTDYNATTSPKHSATAFPTTCESCHSTVDWRASFDHAKTLFPLTGAHVAASCADCHADNVFKGKPTTCVSCHLATYNATRNPSHAATGYSTNCSACHSTAQWLGATFNHSTTAFPLTGAHLAVTCTDCHVNGVYKGTPTACVSCHQTDFNNTVNPHHVPAGFSTTCSSCHTTNPGWRPAPYNHSQTSFPLTGAHVAATCLDCHADRVYDGKLTTCVSCHQADYNNTTNPRHSTVGFPTDCASCHTTTRWLGATFNHDGQFFPIYSGKHNGKWSTCQDCHVNPSNYQVFECILCHQHSNKSEVDNKHSQVNGYQYKSTSCYACHPKGD